MFANRKPFRGVCAALALVAGLEQAHAQTLPPSPVPIAVAPAWAPAQPAPPAPPPSLGRPIPVPYAAPAPSPFVVEGQPTGPLAPMPPAPGPLFPVGDPGRNGWGPYEAPSAPPGLFLDVELQFLSPILKNHLNSDQPLGSVGSVTVPSASLPWTVSPKFELGYHLPDAQGLFAASYRFLVAEGTATPTIDGAAFNVRTRVNLNTFDLDYGTNPYVFSPRYELSYRIGARVSDIFFDSRVQGDVLTRQASNDFTGAGPHARVDLNRQIGFLPGLGLFGRADGSVLIGQIHQRFREDDTNPDGTVTTSVLTRTRTQSVPVLLFQLGLSYTPTFTKNLHFAAGYQYEHYWYLGQFGLDANANFSRSRGELSAQGLFVRGQLDF